MVAIWSALAVSAAMVQYLRFAKKPFALLCLKLTERHIRPLLWLGFFLECAALSVLPLLVIYPVSAALVSILTFVLKERHGFNTCTAFWAFLALAPLGMPFVSDTPGYSTNNPPQMATILHRALTYPGNCYFGGCLVLALIIERCASSSGAKCIAGGLNFSFVSLALKTTIELIRSPAQNANSGRHCIAVALIALCACVCRRAQMHPLREALIKGELSTASVVTLYGLVSALCACGTDVLVFAPRHEQSTLAPGGGASMDGVHGTTFGLLALFAIGLTQLSRHATAAKYATREQYARVPEVEMQTLATSPIGAPAEASDDDFDEWMCAIENEQTPPMLIPVIQNAVSPKSKASVKATTTKVVVDSFADFGAFDSDPFLESSSPISASFPTISKPVPATTGTALNSAAPLHSSFASSTSATVTPFSPTMSLVATFPATTTTTSSAARSPLSATMAAAPPNIDPKTTPAAVATELTSPGPSRDPLADLPTSPPRPPVAGIARTPNTVPSDDMASNIAASTNAAAGTAAAAAGLATPIATPAFDVEMAAQGSTESNNEPFADFNFVALPRAATPPPLSAPTNAIGAGATNPTANATTTSGVPWNVLDDEEDALFKSITDM
eukprot:GEMP01013521.1.p1 GENE.GEMP01013521.1~~GEMP01013521.1.p1  ORF type:complete len:617 (+),score=160.75 GEMP01013521.1:277-2127(+)